MCPGETGTIKDGNKVMILSEDLSASKSEEKCCGVTEKLFFFLSLFQLFHCILFTMTRSLSVLRCGLLVVSTPVLCSMSVRCNLSISRCICLLWRTVRKHEIFEVSVFTEDHCKIFVSHVPACFPRGGPGTEEGKDQHVTYRKPFQQGCKLEIRT